MVGIKITYRLQKIFLCRNSEFLCSFISHLCFCDFTDCFSASGRSPPSRFLVNFQFYDFGRWGVCNFGGWYAGSIESCAS